MRREDDPTEPDIAETQLTYRGRQALSDKCRSLRDAELCSATGRGSRPIPTDGRSETRIADCHYHAPTSIAPRLDGYHWLFVQRGC